MVIVIKKLFMDNPLKIGCPFSPLKASPRQKKTTKAHFHRERMSKKTEKEKQNYTTAGMSQAWGWGMVAAAAVIFFAIVLWPGDSQKPAISLDHANVERGARIFRAQCQVCHGPDAVGENPEMPKGGIKEGNIPLAPALNGTGHTWHHSPDLLFKIVKEGSPAKESPMKGFAGRLSDSDILSVLAYVQSLWPRDIMEKYQQAFKANGQGG